MKKVYFETIKKWWLALGASGAGVLGLSLFLFLAASGAIEITGYSGDSVCAGTELDPCYAYVNFTANEDIFIYPIDYDPWGRNTIMEFSPGVKDWKLQRSWGSGWRTIPLDKSCTGTWCGLSNSKDTRKFSVAFREGRDYQIRIVALKNHPEDNIKWAVNYEDKEYLDPEWLSPTVKTFDNSSGIITIKDRNDTVLAELKLNTPQINYVIRGEETLIGEFDVNGKEQYSTVSEITELYDLKNNNKEITRDVTYKIKNLTPRNVSEMQDVCTVPKETNETITCDVVINTKIVYDISWEDIDEHTDFSNVTVGVFADVRSGDMVEWVPTLYDVRITEWAVWQESYNVGLMAYYNFDQDAGTELPDVTGQYPNGTFINTPSWAGGILGNALDFTKASQEGIELQDIDHQETGTTSIFAWAKFATLDASAQYVVGKVGNGSNPYTRGPVLGLESGLVRTQLFKGSAPITAGSAVGNFNTTSWYFIGLTYDGTHLSFYSNGVQITNASHSGGIGLNDLNMHIGISEGNNGGAHQEFFDGLIDEVGIWNRTLGLDEIVALYNGGVGVTFSLDSPPTLLDSVNVSTIFENTWVNFSATFIDSEGAGSVYFNLTIDDVHTTSIGFDSVNSGESRSWIVDPANWSAGDELSFKSEAFQADVSSGTNTTNITVSVTPIQINILNPLNLTYNHTTSLALEVDNSSFVSVSWKYNLNGTTNVSFTPNTTIGVGFGSFHLQVWGTDIFGNENSSEVSFNVLLPSFNLPINILSPLNLTYNYTNSLDLNAWSINASNWRYSLNHTSNQSFSPNSTIGVGPGNYSLIVSADDEFGRENSSEVSFSILDTQLTVTLCSNISSFEFFPNISLYNWTTRTITEYDITPTNSSNCSSIYTFSSDTTGFNLQGRINVTLNSTFKLYYNNTEMDTNWKVLIYNLTAFVNYGLDITADYINAAQASVNWEDEFRLIKLIP